MALPAAPDIDRDALLRQLRAADDRLLAALATQPQAPVPSCPGWDVTTLVTHVGGIKAWSALVVRDQLQERPDTPEPDPGTDAAVWFTTMAEELVDALSSADLDATVWTFRGPGPAAYWVRRSAVEASVHAWDAGRAIGEPFTIDPEVARAGVEEVADLWLPLHARSRGDAPARGSVHLHRTDGEGEWLFADSPDGPQVRREHAKGDAALRAGAADLLLVLWNRLDPADLDHFGDPAVISSWAIPF